MPLTANLRFACDYNQKAQIHVPSSIPSQQKQLTAPTPHSDPKGAFLPASRAAPVVLGPVLEADTAGTAALHHNSTCGTVGRGQPKPGLGSDSLSKHGRHSWHITAAGDKSVQSNLATEHTHLWASETGMRKWSWFKDTRQELARADLRLEKPKFWIREKTDNMPSSILFL